MDYVVGQLPSVLVGQVCGLSADGHPMVRRADDPTPRPAQVVWIPVVPDWKRSKGMRVVLGYQDADPETPIILGLLDAPVTEDPARPKTLKIDSQEELLIECGKAKIMLRADGRIEIRGGNLISRSTGPNKIKGGSVHIN